MCLVGARKLILACKYSVYGSNEQNIIKHLIDLIAMCLVGARKTSQVKHRL